MYFKNVVVFSKQSCNCENVKINVPARRIVNNRTDSPMKIVLDPGLPSSS